MNDVQAAERLRKHYDVCRRADEAEFKSVDAIRKDSPYFTQHGRWNREAIALDYEAMGLFDWEPITAEWLERCGGRNGVFWIDERGEDEVTVLHVKNSGEHWSVVLRQKFGFMKEPESVHLPGNYATRGDLRKLCIGLGITLKETE